MRFIYPPNYKPHTRKEILEERRRLRTEYGRLYNSVSLLLFRHDPIGINFENNPDEYESEVGTILPRLRHCQTEEDAHRVVHQEFVRWFDEATAGPLAIYKPIASEIWKLWLASDLSKSR
jgi:hypothetical protein